MTKHILVSLVGFFMFSLAGIAAASAIAHPEEAAALRTQAVTAVQTVTGFTHSSADDSPEVDSESEVEHRSNTESSDDSYGDSYDDSDDEGEDEDDDRGEHGGRSSTVTNTPSVTTNAPTAQTLTLTQVASHNTITSCYTAVNGSVYDVTTWIGQHPGGASAIKAICGVDGSAAFNDQHGGSRRPESELAGFKIGTLTP
jgi:cytochrome b involved in lipid metabolism